MTALRFALACLALLLLPVAALADSSFSAQQKAEIGAIVRQYLLENPEVLLEVSKELDKRQQLADDRQRQSAVAGNAKQIFHAEADLVAGDPDGDITMVEFFDYNCSWCKKGLPEVLALLKEDKKLRLVMKEFPIFGEDSEYAARAALASRAQGKYWPYHLAMLGHPGHVGKADVDAIAKAQGLDLARLKQDMTSPEIQAVISANQKLAEAMSLNGTPAFIIDSKIIPGYLPKTGLAATIKEVRDGGGCTLC